jgi:hypothetical protein
MAAISTAFFRGPAVLDARDVVRPASRAVRLSPGDSLITMVLLGTPGAQNAP